MPTHHASTSTGHRRLPRLLALAATAGVLIGLLPAATPTATAATGSLALTAGHSASSRIGPKRVTALAATTVTMPSSGPVDVALQFRAASAASGYRAKVTLGADGSVVGSFTRVKSYTQTVLSSRGSLGITARAGEKIHLEATVAAKATVRLYLRAWKDGDPKPSQWQLTASDSSSKRYTKSGYNYLWAYAAAGTPATEVAYEAVQTKAFTAAAAAAQGTGGTSAAESAEAFTVAVMPDTQDETLNPSNPKFSNRTQWLVNNRSDLNLKYVMHSGDVVNWGWLVPSQFDVATKAIAKLADAGIPYSLAIGNHDTAAVGWDGGSGYGGSAYQDNPECLTRFSAAECKSYLLVRNTQAFNKAFPLSSIRDLGGAFESGKVDNIWTTFEVGNTKWLVLTLELWPRKEAVAWASDVVAKHPGHNVLVQTHSYLNSSGSIEQSNGGYGSTSGQYVYDNLIKKYANIKLVFSGHVGQASKRVDTGVNGNRIVSYLETFHSPTTNPVRLVRIEPATGKVTTRIYSPFTNETWSQHATSDTIELVR